MLSVLQTEVRGHSQVGAVQEGDTRIMSAESAEDTLQKRHHGRITNKLRRLIILILEFRFF